MVDIHLRIGFLAALRAGVLRVHRLVSWENAQSCTSATNAIKTAKAMRLSYISFTYRQLLTVEYNRGPGNSVSGVWFLNKLVRSLLRQVGCIPDSPGHCNAAVLLRNTCRPRFRTLWQGMIERNSVHNHTVYSTVSLGQGVQLWLGSCLWHECVTKTVLSNSFRKCLVKFLL